MSSTNCRLCGATSRHIFDGVIMGRYRVSYFDCENCGYLQTETPYWLEEAYQKAINISDVGILQRNLANARIVQATLDLLPKSHLPVVDFAGGYGLLVRRLRDVGIDARWRDEYCANLLACGFEHNNEPAALATAFEVFEHFVDPVSEASKIIGMAPTILLSTELLGDGEAPALDDWYYYGLNHGQHIGFFRRRSLQWLAEKLGKQMVSDGRLYHVFTSDTVNETLWRFLKKYNRVYSLKNLAVRNSLTASDFNEMVQVDMKSRHTAEFPNS